MEKLQRTNRQTLLCGTSSSDDNGASSRVALKSEANNRSTSTMATGNIGYIFGDGESATTAGSSSTSKYAKKHDAQLRLEGSKADKKPKADPQTSSSADQGKHDARWEQMFEKLLNYKEGHGDCLVPNRYEPDPSLGAWVSTQRR
jgi:hypothetical protein